MKGSPAHAGVNFVKPQLLVDSFQLPPRVSKKKRKNTASSVNDDKPSKPKKRTTPKRSSPKRTSLTQDNRRTKPKAQREEQLSLFLHCGRTDTEEQTTWLQSADEREVSQGTYGERKRSAASNQTSGHQQAMPGQASPSDNTAHGVAGQAEESQPNLGARMSTSPDRREYERLRGQRPERKEAHRQAQVKRRQQAKELGLCRSCNAKAIPGQTRCETCAEKHRASRRIYDAKRRETAKKSPKGIGVTLAKKAKYQSPVVSGQ